jgi:hypothetical protein
MIEAKVSKNVQKCMEAADSFGISPKKGILTPKTVYILKVWTCIYRFMHNLLSLFARCKMQDEGKSFVNVLYRD